MLLFSIKPKKTLKAIPSVLYTLCEYYSSNGTILVLNSEIYEMSYNTTFCILLDIYKQKIFTTMEYYDKKKNFLDKMGVNSYIQQVLLYSDLEDYKTFKGECLHKGSFKRNVCPLHTEDCLCLYHWRDGLIKIQYQDYYIDIKNGRIFHDSWAYDDTEGGGYSFFELVHSDILEYLYKYKSEMF